MGPWWWCDGVNMATFMPAVDKILERYILKFSKGGKAKLHEDDLGLRDPNDVDQTEHGGYYARYGEQAPQHRGEHAGVHTRPTLWRVAREGGS